MDLKKVSSELEEKLSDLFVELRSGISEREDSRSFGAMIEKRITDNWKSICSKVVWDRDIVRFYDLFVDLAIQHYRRVSRDAMRRIAALEEFRKNDYKHFTFA